MWTFRKTTESGTQAVKIVIDAPDNQLRFSDVLRLLLDDAGFRQQFTEQLQSTPFEAFRWENPPVTTGTIDRPFECVVLNSPELLRPPVDMQAFAEHFLKAEQGVAVFSNLGQDATMVAPSPQTENAAYGHLAAFLQRAPQSQVHALWRRVSQTVFERLTDAPIWLNTAGAGVAWLHVRLDSRPKYYRHAPYRSPTF